MSTVTKVLLVVFFAYVLQSVFAFLQIKRSYGVISAVKAQHQGTPVTLVTGTGRTKLLIIARGYFIIMCVSDDDVIVDYYGMDGYTVFATPKQKKQYIGMTLDEAEATFTKKNEKRAFADAREQLELLRSEQEAAEADDYDEDDEDIEEEYESSEASASLE